jgi:hypothetical protein
LNPNPESTGNVSTVRRVIAYYADCVREEHAGVEAFDVAERRCYAEWPLDQDWPRVNFQQRLPLNDGSRFWDLARQQGPQAVLYYAYPLYLQSRDGKTWGVPALMWQVNLDFDQRYVNLEIASPWPRLNSDFLAVLFSLPEEKQAFVERAGLADCEGTPPPDLVDRFVALLTEEFPHLIRESLDPSGLDN